jgi:hypothetical protein
MATIRIDSSTLQDHFEDSCSINVTAFGWSTYSGVTDVEYDVEVGDELAYDDDDYIEIEEYNELKDSLQESLKNHKTNWLLFKQNWWK